ncbi:MAG: MOSC domain-containing protein [Anaerolineales bacterium]
MKPAIILSIQVGTPQRYEGQAGEKPWTTAFFKTPLSGKVRLTRMGLDGDQPADRKHHGGADKAVLAYAASHYPIWRQELGRQDMTYGGFAENFTIQGLDEETVCIGDTYKIDDVLVQVSQPRQPCWKISRRWGIEGLTNLVRETLRMGWYLRVLGEGNVQAGMAMVLLERPCPQWTVARAFRVYNSSRDDPVTAAELGKCEMLSKGWLEKLRGNK